ncbi:hypothetical protein MVEN_00868900 [Mycena venus]|uniref:Uncharacterized protein n=1 Tax=Mycena venus TaxID=2733690 RepID=A0A8H6YH79_9AGAR|nr:hypothetical protein MVEN_00868900 [Mycena venus]
MGATTPPRQRVIDDTDPAIQYGPNGWFVADPSTLNVGNFGPIYQDTSHATTSTSNLTFPFNGTAISVFGTIIVKTVNNVTDPTWDCFVDEIQISNPQPTFQFPENNWLLCEQPQIAPGSHNLTIQVQSKGQAFYLDYLTYTPLPDASFDTAVLIYPNTDPAVSFGSGWSNIGDLENATNVFGSDISLFFHGTSVSPYAFVPTELPHNATWATYTIDNGSPVNFTLNGLSSPQSPTEYFVPLFATPTIPSGPHNLVITYGGDSHHTPLVIQRFYVTNTTSAAADSPGSSSSPSSSSPSPSPSSKSTKGAPAGAIAGGIIGGIVVLALLAALAFFCQRRRRRRDPDPTSANPYPMSMADAAAPPLAAGAPAPPSGQPYVYSAVPANGNSSGYPFAGTGAATAATSSSGALSGARTGTEDSRPSTTYPYLHRAEAPVHHHPSDAMSSSRGTHAHQLSASSVPASGSGASSAEQHQYPYGGGSTSAVVSHAHEPGFVLGARAGTPSHARLDAARACAPRADEARAGARKGGGGGGSAEWGPARSWYGGASARGQRRAAARWAGHCRAAAGL